jgi:dihydroorotate dehydrogenase electron transfer subunit
VDPKARHILLVAGGLGMAGVRSLADQALAANRNVVMLFGAASAAEVYPSSLLPDEVEYLVSTDDGSFGHHGLVTELVTKFEAWADQAFACGPYPMLAAMAGASATRQRRLGVAAFGPRRGRGTKQAPLGSRQARRKAWLQVSMEQNMGCAVGACLGCVIMGVDGPQRVCREGPVFASDEIVWEARWP